MHSGGYPDEKALRAKQSPAASAADPASLSLLSIYNPASKNPPNFELPSGVIEIPAQRPSLCGNPNCPGCGASSLASSANMDAYFNRSRICSSNDSSQLDDSYDYSRCASPPRQVSALLLGRQRARSLSCSPSKVHNESDIVLLQNEKFKDKFPKACQQMEERLQQFIEASLDLRTQIDYCQPEPAAR